MRSSARAVLLTFVLAPLASACFVDSISAQGAGGAGAGNAGGSGAGGGPGGGGSDPSGGAPQGGMGPGPGGSGGGGGSGTCGNGVEEAGEECDDADDADPLDGCTSDCTFGPLDGCSVSQPTLLSPGETLTLEGTTVGAADDLALNGDFPGLTCDSDGADLFQAVRVEEAGAVRIRLQVGPGGAWGASMEKGVLQVRTGCNGGDPGQVLLCKETTLVNGSDPEVGAVEARLFAAAGQVLSVVVDGTGNNEQGPYQLTIEHFVCGDGAVQAPEQCDEPQDCDGCLLTDPLLECGGNDADTRAFLGSAGQCFVVETLSNQSFYEARARCVELGGDLASLSTAAEKAAFDAQLQLPSLVWFGIEDFAMDDSYRWLDGVAFDGPWEPSNPNNGENEPRCGALEPDDTLTASWAQDLTCDSDLDGFVCELKGASP